MIPIDQQIKCVQREIALRKNAYPKWVASGRMEEAQAVSEIDQMQAVLESLHLIKELALVFYRVQQPAQEAPSGDGQRAEQPQIDFPGRELYEPHQQAPSGAENQVETVSMDALQGFFAKCGFDNSAGSRERRLHFARAVVRRKLQSFNALSADERVAVYKSLRFCRECFLELCLSDEARATRALTDFAGWVKASPAASLASMSGVRTEIQKYLAALSETNA